MPSDRHSQRYRSGRGEGLGAMHQRFGKLPWKELFQTPSRMRSRAFRSPKRFRNLGRCRTSRNCGPTRSLTRVFLPGGKAPQEGDLFRNPDLARALPADRG